MQYFREKRKWFFILFISLFLSLMAAYQIKRKNSTILAKKQTLEIILLSMENLLKLWQEGEDSLLKNHCPGRCRASLLQCFFEKRDREGRPHLSVEKEGKNFGIVARRQGEDYYRIMTRENTEGVSIPSYGVFMELALIDNPKIIVPILLEDSCHDVYLPRRVYSYGPFEGPDKEDFRWDNFAQHIYLDKYPVNFFQIVEWIKFNKSQREISRGIVIPKDIKKLSKSASGLSKKQMENYCVFRGGQLLQAHYYDAATFYPSDFADKKPLKNIRGPYPWTNKSKAFFSDEKTYCHKIYTKECLNKAAYEDYKSRSTSWIGMFEILGGYLEVLENKIEPQKNLKASSLLFPANSSWHMLGKRAYWDGKGFEENDFKWEEKSQSNPPSSLDNLQVVFRCMRFVYD